MDIYDEEPRPSRRQWLPLIFLVVGLISFFVAAYFVNLNLSSANTNTSPVGAATLFLPPKITPTQTQFPVSTIFTPQNPSPPAIVGTLPPSPVADTKIFRDDLGNVIILNEHAYLLEAQSLVKIVSISEDGATYTFQNAGEKISRLGAGDVIVAGISEKTPYGFLRKVEFISTSGDLTVVRTNSATFEDAFAEFRVSLSYDLSPQDVYQAILHPGVRLASHQEPLAQNFMRSASKNAKMIAAQQPGVATASRPFRFEVNKVFDADNSPITINDRIAVNGFIDFQPTVHLFGDISGGNARDSYFGVSIQQDVKLTFDAQVDVLRFQEEARIPLANFTARAPMTVAGFPIILSIPISLSVGIDGTISGVVSSGFEGSNLFFAGAKNNNGVWQPHIKSDFSLINYIQPRVSSFQEFRTFIGLDIAIRPYHLIGIHAQAREYLKLIANPLGQTTWQLFRGTEILVGIESDFLFKRPLRLDFPIYHKESLIKQAEPQRTATRTIRATVSISTVTPIPTSSIPQWARISSQISFAALRHSPGYITKDDSIDIIVEVPSRQHVRILDGPKRADGLDWWLVSWNGYQGWMAEKTGQGKVILVFEP